MRCDPSLDGLLAFSAVALSTLAPKMLGSYRQRFAVYIWIGVMVFVFSYLVRIFKIKNGGEWPDRRLALLLVGQGADLIVFGSRRGGRLSVQAFPWMRWLLYKRRYAER